MEGALVIGISQSGRAADVLEVLKSAKAQGVPTIAITIMKIHPWRQRQITIYSVRQAEKSVAATKTFTSTLYLWQILHRWTEMKISRNLQLFPNWFKRLLTIMNRLKIQFCGTDSCPKCYVLGRGMNYSITLETALKLMETTYVRARGFAISDFYHGPFAVVDKHLPVFVFARKESPKRTLWK